MPGADLCAWLLRRTSCTQFYGYKVSFEKIYNVTTWRDKNSVHLWNPEFHLRFRHWTQYRVCSVSFTYSHVLLESSMLRSTRISLSFLLNVSVNLLSLLYCVQVLGSSFLGALSTPQSLHASVDIPPQPFQTLKAKLWGTGQWKERRRELKERKNMIIVRR